LNEVLDIGVEIIRRNFPSSDIVKIVAVMDPEAAKTARDSLNLAFHMSNLLDTGLDRHTLSVLIALCDLGLNPEALAAVVKELRREPVSSSLPNSSAPVAKP
jgi:mitotic-spindle organizing protein 1